MRKTTETKTRERRGPSPGQTFEIWIDSKHLELNVRKVAKEFAEWVNSGGREFDGYSGLKKSFLELTQLTVDLTGELRQIRDPASAVRSVGAALHKSIVTIERYRGKINALLMRLQRHRGVLEMLDFPDPGGMPVLHDGPACHAAKDFDRFSTAVTTSYVLKQFHFLFERGAFADFRRCALRTCKKYFFPLRPERRYCSDACQGKDYLRDPLRTKKNAAYQKVNYYTKKVQECAPVKADHQEDYDHAKKALKLAEAKLAALKRR